MNNFTLADKKALETLAEAGNLVGFVAYNPTLPTATNPETAALAAGWTQYYREAAANLIEVIYTKPAPDGTYVGTDTVT